MKNWAWITLIVLAVFVTYAATRQMPQTEIGYGDLSTARAGDECVIDMAKFNALVFDMPLARVLEIIGCQGATISEGGIPNFPEYYTVMYRWSGKNPAAGAVVMFQGGKLTSKSQIGL